MNINIKTKNIELTNAVRKYVVDKIGELEKYIQFVESTVEQGQRDPVIVDVEIGRTSRHHRKGENIYRAEINVSLPGEKYILRTESEQWDLYVAIDKAKEEMQGRMKKYRAKRATKFERGERVWKRLMRLSRLAKRKGEE